MGLFKNEVGRPSNETIKKRNIFKGICVLLVIVIIGLVAYILNDKGIIDLSNKKSGNENKKIETTTKKVVINEVMENNDSKSDKCLDLSKVDIRTFSYSFLDDNKEYNSICYGNKQIELGYDKKINEEGPGLVITRVIIYNDLYVVLTGIMPDTLELHIIDSNGNILGQYEGNFETNEVPSYRTYSYSNISGEMLNNVEVKDGKLYIYSHNLGQDYKYNACKRKTDLDVAEYIDVIEYNNGKLSNIKNISKKTIKEWKKENNVDCSNVE